MFHILDSVYSSLSGADVGLGDLSFTEKSLVLRHMEMVLNEPEIINEEYLSRIIGSMTIASGDIAIDAQEDVRQKVISATFSMPVPFRVFSNESLFDHAIFSWEGKHDDGWVSASLYASEEALICPIYLEVQGAPLGGQLTVHLMPMGSQALPIMTEHMLSRLHHIFERPAITGLVASLERILSESEEQQVLSIRAIAEHVANNQDMMATFGEVIEMAEVIRRNPAKSRVN